MLSDERKNGTFPTRDLTHFLDGGAANTALLEMIMVQFERDPVMATSEDHALAAAREATMQKVPVD